LVILKKAVAGTSETALARFASRAKKAAGLRGEVAVLVTGNREIRKLNKNFRKKDKPTDVISFPSEVGGVAGDIAISAEIAQANARALGHDVAAELKVLILHGMLHLAGFDHEADDGEMARKEARLRKQLGLPVGLIERANGHAAQPRTSEARTGNPRRTK
jgi:probable rRNA maturation factor